jgi:hypothetical protein
MNAKERLDRLEGDRRHGEVPKDAEKRRQEIRRRAEHANHRQSRDEEPAFIIMPSNDVFCARDGRPVTDPRQILSERFYWREVSSGGRDLIHDEENQQFYTLEGDLALSRDFVHLERLLGDKRMKAWESETG